MDYNNLYKFMDIRNLSSCQVRWVQKLSHYHFKINYHQNKVNEVGEVLSQFLYKSPEEKNISQAKNIMILHCLQSSLTNTSLFGLNFQLKASLLSIYQVYICGIYVLPQLCQFWDLFQDKLTNKKLYTTNIGSMRLSLPKL